MVETELFYLWLSNDHARASIWFLLYNLLLLQDLLRLSVFARNSRQKLLWRDMQSDVNGCEYFLGVQHLMIILLLLMMILFIGALLAARCVMLDRWWNNMLLFVWHHQVLILTRCIFARVSYIQMARESFNTALIHAQLLQQLADRPVRLLACTMMIQGATLHGHVTHEDHAGPLWITFHAEYVEPVAFWGPTRRHSYRLLKHWGRRHLIKYF